jgi:hypothetical protein
MRLIVRRAPTTIARFLAMFFVIPEKKELMLERFGAMVWEMSDGTVTARQIAERLAEEAGWPKEEACKSVLIYLSMLSSKMLMSVERNPAASPPAGGDPAASPPAGGDPAASPPAGGDPAAPPPAGGDPAASPPAGGRHPA